MLAGALSVLESKDVILGSLNTKDNAFDNQIDLRLIRVRKGLLVAEVLATK
jgi:hypothetical protein